MLDIKYIREQKKRVLSALESRGVSVDLEKVVATDDMRLAKLKEVEELRSKQNTFAREIANADGAEREKKISESKKIKTKLAGAEEELEKLEAEVSALVYALPNIPAGDVPVGRDEKANKVVREWGDVPKFDFPPKNHLEIGEGLGMIDTERAGKVSGTRFGYLVGAAARMEIALVQFAFEKLQKSGFIPVVPPVFVTEEMMRGMGYIDTDEDREERYFFEKDGLYLVGTAEQSLVPMHAKETFREDDVPRRYVGFSTCFRREAGSYGQDTRGIMRVHQFDKVEMVIFSKPEDSAEELRKMVALQEELMQSLRLPYRVVALSTGDLSRPSAQTFDIETWMPGENRYRETHSSSNTTDFQARRLGIRVKTNTGTKFAHILNGTALAIGRTLVAILENYQQKDGSVAVPTVLQKYMSGVDHIKKM